MVAAFAKMGSTHRLSLAENSTFFHADGDHYSEEVARQEKLESEFDYLVYETGVDTSAWTQRAFRQADQVVFVASTKSSHDLGVLERRLMNEPGYAMKRRHLVVLHPSDTVYPSAMRSWVDGRDVERIYPTRCDHPGDYERLAQRILLAVVVLPLRRDVARDLGLKLVE